MLEGFLPIEPPRAGSCRVRDAVTGGEWLVVGLPEGAVPSRVRRLARLRHPAFARLRDAGVSTEGAPALGLSAGQAWLVTAAPPPDARPLLVAAPGFAGEDLLALAAQLLAALDVLHGCGGALGDLPFERVLVASGPRPLVVGLGPGDAPRDDLAWLGRLLRAALAVAPHGATRRARAPSSRTWPAPCATAAAARARSCASCWSGRRRPRASSRATFRSRRSWGVRTRSRRSTPSSSRAAGPGSPATRAAAGAASWPRPRRAPAGAACARSRWRWPPPSRPGASCWTSRAGPLLATFRDADGAPPDRLERLAGLAAATGPLGAGRLALAITALSGPGEGAPPALERAAAARPCRVVPIGPLDDAALRQLVAASLGRRRAPSPLVRLVAQRSGGLAGLARRALTDLVDAGALAPNGARVDVDPSRLRGALAVAPPGEALLPRLGRDARRVVRALCVAPGWVPRPALAAVAGLDGRPLDEALAPLLRRGVLREDAGRVALSRDLARVQAHAAVAPAERRLLHRAHLAALAPAPDEAEPARLDALDAVRLRALAHHALGAGDARSVAWTRGLARREQAAGAPRRAAEALEGLLAHPPGRLRPALRVALLRERGDALLAGGDPDAATAAYAQALGTRSPDLPPGERARLHAARAGAALALGDLPQAREALRRALDGADALPPDDHVAHARVAVLAANEALRSGRLADALALTRAALATDLPDGLRASLLNARGLARLGQGELDRAERLLRRALRLCRTTGHTVGAATVLGNLALVAAHRGDVALAERRQRRVVTLARRARLVALEASAWNNLGNLANEAGRLRRARARYRRSLALCARCGDQRASCLALASLADAWLAAAEPARARRTLSRAARQAEALGFEGGLALARVNLAHALLFEGDLAAARREAEAGLALRRRLGEPERTARAGVLLARVEARLGRFHEAGAALDEAAAQVGAEGARHARAELALARAELLLEQVRAEAPAAAEEARRGALAARLPRVAAAAALLRARARLAARSPEATADAVRAEAEAAAVGASDLVASARLVAARAALQAGRAPDDASLDAARAARSLATARGLPELARAAAATLALLLERAGRPDEARAERLAARMATERVTERLPVALARSHRARPLVREDLAPVAARPAAGPRVLPAPPAHPAADAGDPAADAADAPLAAGLRPERHGLVGRSDALLAALARVARYAPLALPVLVTGESGTGKELVARALHDAGSRRDGPFVAVNTAALPDELVPVELFGAARGAYTDATEDRPGLFELASGGTLFLDEVGDMSLGAQAMLLRALDAGEVRRVGSGEARRVDVRIIAATHHDLEACVRTGAFRADLFYRLGGLPLPLPPLREREGDAVLLARHTLRQAGREGRGQARRLAPDAVAAIEAHAWPGNVRELKNAVERAVALCESDVVRAVDLGLAPAGEPPARAMPRLAEVERAALRAALSRHRTLAAAARELGIDRRTLARRLERHGLEPRAVIGPRGRSTPTPPP